MTVLIESAPGGQHTLYRNHDRVQLPVTCFPFALAENYQLLLFVEPRLRLYTALQFGGLGLRQGLLLWRQ